ncbi:Alpha/beta hydrolase fold-3 [uncultured Caudovirales phage]|uniref:Alpha/beta hydrolase fold-3 n=1 Tax=uncultured Caudovirales phage TaxID=2100421 RepID=A0A6J5PLE9_9CAUD|nr:Alpha/beta hydrolase fold-3 [uncultured Caudovirales phage]CAB4202895.1 Alpha/beta hydrolase fold-3 [uncultured Caudovirales phage]
MSNNKRDFFSEFLWMIITIVVFLFLLVIWNFPLSAQTIVKKYDGVHKIRIDGSHPDHLGKGYVFFCGGGFVVQNWGVCNKWEAMAVADGDVSFRVGYSTSFLYPTLSAVNRGVDDCATALQMIQMICKQYGVHPDSIYLCGTSAGGIVAMQLAYSKGYDVAGILNGWGAILNINDLQNNNVPVLNIGTVTDKTVPPDCGQSFGVNVCGQNAIYQRMLLMGIPTDQWMIDGYKHGMEPKDMEYNWRIENCFNLFKKFIK